MNNCYDCRGSGWVVAVHRQVRNIYSFRCQCPRGSRLSLKIAQWTASDAKVYERDERLDDALESNPRASAPKPIHGPKVDYQALAANDFDDDMPF